jgi:5-methylcytosine-specific restriction endonuclease McrA
VRDNGLCQPCLKGSRVSRASQVDHIIPKADGGNDDDNNLQSICVACHRAKTATEGGIKSPSRMVQGPEWEPNFHRREIGDKK